MKINKYILAFTAFVMMLFAACSPEDNSLGSKNLTSADLAQGLAFTITPDTDNPNIIHLKSLLSGYTVIWETPQGRSQSSDVDLKIPFPGDYYVRFGVETRGGIVFSDSTKFTVSTTYLGFVSDKLWTCLSGGVGKSKKWIPNDYAYVDADGYKMAAGELTYADPSTTVEYNNWAANWDPGKGVTGDAGIFNSSMTFSLSEKDGAKVSIVNETSGATENTRGTYMLDADNHTLTFNDCSILHTQSWDSKSSNWSIKLKVLKLTDNFLQLAIWRDTSTEGTWWMVLNFVSEDFKNNYVKEEPTITLPDNWQNSMQQSVITTVKWTLNTESPYNWVKSDGTFENSWNSPADYPNWGQGTWSADRLSNFSMTLNSADKSVTFTDIEGKETSGTYSIGDDGWITFTDVQVPSFDITTGGGWSIGFAGEGNTKLRVIKLLYNAVGAVSGMWVGKWNKEGEYTAYRLDASTGAAAADPYAAWNSALSGKTFTMDPSWFCDWTTGFDVSTGWTSSASFEKDGTYPDAWCYDATTKAVITTSRLSFTGKGKNMQATLKYTKADGTAVSESGAVTIDTDNNTVTFAYPLVDLTGATGAWMGNDNAAYGAYWSTKACAANEWIFANHGGSNLTTVSTNGFWLGRVTNALALGTKDSKDELLLFHWIPVSE